METNLWLLVESRTRFVADAPLYFVGYGCQQWIPVSLDFDQVGYIRRFGCSPGRQEAGTNEGGKSVGGDKQQGISST